MYISNVIALVASGGLDYSDSNRRKVLGSLRRCAVIHDAPAERIPADLGLFDRRWGRGKIKTYPIASFTSADQFRTWRSNVRGAIGQFTGEARAAATRRAAKDDWADLLAIFDDVAGPADQGFVFNPRGRIGLERVADLARRDGIAPAAISTADVMRYRDRDFITQNQKTMMNRAAELLDRLRLIPGTAHLLPPEPLGPLPKKRLMGGERLAAMPAGFRAEWSRWRAEYQRGTPSPLSGSSEAKSDSYMYQFDAAVLWYLETVGDLGRADRATVAGLREIARPDWIKAAARSVLARYDEDGDPVDDADPPRLSVRSLQTYLERLRTLFHRLDCAEAAKALDRMLEDGIFAGLDGMTPQNIAFCRSLVTSVSRQTTFFELPFVLQAKAQALLDRWDALTPVERHEAVRAGVCAVALLILTRCAPIRIGNLAAIPFKGGKRWLSAPTDGRKALLLIPARHVKNRKEIRAHLGNAGRRDSWALVSWFLANIRPRMIDGSLDHLKATESPALFPGKAGSLKPSTLRDWIMIETAAAGFPMRPHQARHAIVSILLNRHPDKIVLIAALLGDTVSTVEKTYAWLDREKLVADAQDLIPTAARILREARHG